MKIHTFSILLLTAIAASGQSAIGPNPAGASAPGSEAPVAPPALPYGRNADQGFLQRLGAAEAEQNASPAFTPAPPPPPGTPPARRIGPQPFDAPPYPT